MDIYTNKKVYWFGIIYREIKCTTVASFSTLLCFCLFIYLKFDLFIICLIQLMVTGKTGAPGVLATQPATLGLI